MAEAAFPYVAVRQCRHVCLLLLTATYAPTLYRLFSYGWRQVDYSHGPLILLVFLWLVWQKRKFLLLLPDERVTVSAMTMLVSGLVLHVFGARNQVLLFETVSLIPVFLGAVHLLYGRAALRLLLFPAAFLAFLVPPPLFVIDAVTSPLKMLVSAVSAPILTALGYAVTRDGVILSVGDYSIVIGDACSGLRSFVSLLAVGSLYARQSGLPALRRSILLVSTVPISVVANIVRLLLLALVTYYLGDSAGQAFFHDYSGLFLFVFSLIALVLVDVALGRRSACDTPA